MKEVDKKKPSNGNQTKRSRRTDRRDRNPHQENGRKSVNTKKTESKASNAPSGSAVKDQSNATSEVYENVVIHYVDDVNRSEEGSTTLKSCPLVDKDNKGGSLDGHSSDLEENAKQSTEDVSDSDTIKDSVSSLGDSQTGEDEKVERDPRISEGTAKKISSDKRPPGSRVRSDKVKNNTQVRAVASSPRTATKSSKEKSRSSNIKSSNRNSKNVKCPLKPSSESSEGVDDKLVEEVKDVDVLNEVSNAAQSVGSDGETCDAEENGAHEDKAPLEVSNAAQSVGSDRETFDTKENGVHEDKAHFEVLNAAQSVGNDREIFDTEENGAHEDTAHLEHKIEEVERRVEKLEEELRVVAALEISLYSVVPEHGSSAHKVHTPARRLSRLYIHACKFWTQNKRATTAKNTVSGLVLIAKSCGNDVPRLTFWLSNTIVLREIISKTFGSSRTSNPWTKIADSNVTSKIINGTSASLKWKGSSSNGQMNGFMESISDWQETGTFTAALEKVESWIFSRVVESVWWQAMTPHMQSPDKELSSNKSIGRLMGPPLGDLKQGSFSIDLWTNAFQDSLQRLCPVRAAGHECGCLPLLARMVMEQCVSRLDVAMFNAILRESAHQTPTDPISDPIVDSKVLPIPAGELSFGSGAQLKNAVGNWTRSLSDMFGIDTDDSIKEDQHENGDDDRWGRDQEPRCFPLLNSLSDLLMLPKDLLLDPSVRHEVCPQISLPLVKRVLCNFCPDEFCPDPVPGAVLEELNAESISDRRLSGDFAISFPYTASPAVYNPPSSVDVAEKVAEVGGRSHLFRNVSDVQSKGHTSDEELEGLEFPLISIVDRLPSSPTVVSNGSGNGKDGPANYTGMNARYGLLQEVWSEI